MTKRFSFVAEITLVVDANGTTQTFYFGTEGFSTKPTDNPANTVVRELLTDPGSIRRELFSGARVTGENRPTYGQLVLINAAGVLDDWIDYGVSGGKVTVRYGEVGTAYPVAWTTVYVAYAYSLIVDFDQVRVLLRDRLYLLDRPIVQDVFAGTGALEGTGIATGTKQVVFGRPGYIPLQLIDQNRQIYFVHANASDERAFVVAGQRYLVYDGGVPLTHQGYATSEADFLATTPSAGHFTIYGPGAVPPTPRTKGPIYIRLGSPAAFDLRVAPIGLLQNFSYENPRTWTFRDLCSRAGMNVFLTPGSYDKQVGNYLVDGDQTYLQVMSDACKSTFSAYGFDNLDNFFTIDLKDPSEGTDDPVYTFDVHNSKSITRQPVPGQEVPVWQVQVSSGRTWPGSTATSLTSEEKDTFTRQPWQNAFTGTSTSVKTANPGAEIASVEIVGRDLDSQDARLAFVRRYLYLFGTRRDLITLTAPFCPALLDILLHSKVQVKMPRLGCASGRTFRVVTQSYDLRARTVTFGLWGGDPGPSDASLTGGATSIGGGSNPVEVVIPGNVILSNFVQRAWGSVLGGGGGGVSILNDWVQRAWGSVSLGLPEWSAETVGSRSKRSIAYGGGRFVIGDIDGSGYATSQWSSDGGQTWTNASTSVNAFGNPANMAFGNGRFVAQLNAIQMMTSTDGDTWAGYNHTSLSTAGDIWFGNGEFFICGTSAFIATADGITEDRTGSLPTNTGNAHGAYGGGTYVVVGTAGPAYSTDGATWTAGTVGAFFSNITRVAYGAGKFVAISGGGGAEDRYVYSSDGITWSVGTLPLSVVWRDILFAQGRFIACAFGSGLTGQLATSSDGVNWTLTSGSKNFTDTDGFQRMATDGAGKYVAIRLGTSTVSNIAPPP